jgi:hypothetical protein
MTENRTIEIHTFRIHQNGKPNSFYNFDNIEGQDLYKQISERFIKFIDKKTDLGKYKKSTYHIKEKDEEYSQYWAKSDKNQILQGYLSTGSYGTEQDIYDTINKVSAGKKTKNQALMMPFFFLISISKKKDTGFIILERIGPYGINSIFHRIFKEFVKEINPKLYTTFNAHVDSDVIREYVTEGDLNQITLTKKSLHADVSKRLNVSEFDTEDFTVQLLIKAKNKTSFTNSGARKKVVESLDKDYKNFFVGEDFEKLGFDEDTNISIVSNLNGSKKTFDLSNTMKMRPYYIIESELNSKGYSDFKSMSKNCITFMKENLDYETSDEKIVEAIIKENICTRDSQ